jgi:O-succinylbenzoic acid--CoA ligase
MDRMLVSGGENIHPEAIECFLAEVPGVRRAAVVAIDHSEFGQRPVAFIDGAVEEGVLRDHLGGRLERFALPDRFFPWPHEIVADAAKIDYPALTAIAQLLSTGGRQGST